MIMVCLDLFFTSSDTTSAALGFAVLYMIHNPDVMYKVQKEIDTVIGPNRIPNLDDKKMYDLFFDHWSRILNYTLVTKLFSLFVYCSMPYVEATTLEVLRFSSINPIAGRSPNKDSFINGYFIPKVSFLNLL